METNLRSKKMKFKNLNIGDRFCFSNSKRGPYIKISPRKYVIEYMKNLRYAHEVFSINIEVTYAVHTEY